MAEELKVCPFCGKKPRIMQCNPWKDMPPQNRFWVRCENAECGVNPESHVFDGEAFIAAWNTRHEPPAEVYPLDEWRDNDGVVMWVPSFPPAEQPWFGTPLDEEFNPRYYKFWFRTHGAFILKEKR